MSTDAVDDVTGPAAPGQRPELAEVGRYRIVELIGSNSSARAYLATDPIIGRKVAIKILNDRTIPDDHRTAFLREARLLGQVRHRHVLPVLDAGEAGGLPYFVMPYFRMSTLYDRMKTGPLPAPEVVRIAHGLAAALDAVHARAIVHRNIKPSNVLLDDSDEVVLAGFDYAQTADDVEPGLVGTPLYMSPEQFRAEGNVDARSDLFSLGVVMYSALAGRPPFAGDTVYRLAEAVAVCQPPQLSQVVPGSSERLALLVHRLLRKDPAERPPDAKTVLAELTEIEREYREPELVGRGGAGCASVRGTPMAERTDKELARELHELGKQLPKPQYGDAYADARWFDQCIGTPAFEPYRGNFVAVLNEAVVGHGPNALQLQLDVARERNVHPHRLIVEYIPRAEF